MRGEYLPNVIAQGLGRFMTMSANFAAYVFIARYFEPDTLGKYTYILNFISIASSLVELGTTAVMTKQLAEVHRNEAQLYWGTFLFLRIFAYLFFLGPILGVASILRSDLFIFLFWSSLALPFLAFRFFEPVYQIYSRPWYSTLSNGCYSIVWITVIWVIISFVSTLGCLITGYILANIFYTVLAFYLSSCLLRPRLRINIDYFKNILSLAAPIWVSSIFSIFNIRISIFMLSSMQSDVAVGLYSVPFRFFEMAVVLGVVLTYPLIPIFSKMGQNNLAMLKVKFTQIFEIVTIAVIPIALAAPLFSKNIINVFFGSKFIETASALNVIAWIVALLFLNLLCSVLCLTLGVVRHGFWNTAFALMLTIALNYSWINEYGYIACAWSALVSEIFLFIIVMYFIFKKMGNFINLRRWIYILGANLIFFLWVNYISLNLNINIHIILGLCIYVAVIFLTKIIDLSALVSMYDRIRAIK